MLVEKETVIDRVSSVMQDNTLQFLREGVFGFSRCNRDVFFNNFASEEMTSPGIIVRRALL